MTTAATELRQDGNGMAMCTATATSLLGGVHCAPSRGKGSSLPPGPPPLFPSAPPPLLPSSPLSPGAAPLLPFPPVHPPLPFPKAPLPLLPFPQAPRPLPPPTALAPASSAPRCRPSSPTSATTLHHRWMERENLLVPARPWQQVMDIGAAAMPEEAARCGSTHSLSIVPLGAVSLSSFFSVLLEEGPVTVQCEDSSPGVPAARLAGASLVTPPLVSEATLTRAGERRAGEVKPASCGEGKLGGTLVAQEYLEELGLSGRNQRNGASVAVGGPSTGPTGRLSSTVAESEEPSEVTMGSSKYNRPMSQFAEENVSLLGH